MDVSATTMTYSRYLSHADIVHRPGERELAREFLSLLGIAAHDTMGGRFMMSVIEPETYDPMHFANFLGGSEVSVEQWAFDQALMESVNGGALTECFNAYQKKLDSDPTSGMHLGIHFSTVDAWESAVARLELAQNTAGTNALSGRFHVCSVTRPGDPASVAPLYQAFIWTDVVSASSLALGQRFELSAVDPVNLMDGSSR